MIKNKKYKRSIEDAGRISDKQYYNIMEDVATINYKDWWNNEGIKYYNEDKKERRKKVNGGSIYIAPSKHGTFTAAARNHGMGVQEFASKVLSNKDNYSVSMVKKANFARNASKWNK